MAATRPRPHNVCFTMHGIGVSGGIAIGHAHLFLGMSTEVDHYEIAADDVQREQRRYDRAVKEVRDELKELADSVRHSAASELAPFVKVHLMLLDDGAFTEAPREIIREQRCNAEWALRVQLDELHRAVRRHRGPVPARARGRRAPGGRARAGGAGRLASGASRSSRRARTPTILVARDLSPADVILFREHPFAAFVTDMGGATSHTAIVARSLNIPAIVALHHSRTMIREDELIIVDGTQGVVIVNPDRAVLAEYRLQAEPGAARARQAEAPEDRARGHARRHASCSCTPTSSCPSDVEAVRASGADRHRASSAASSCS